MIKTFWVSSCKQDHAIVLSQELLQPPFLTLTHLFVQNLFIYLWKAAPSRRSAEEYAVGWQALISRSLKTLNQAGEEPSLALVHLVRTPPTVSFYNFALWWKFLKPLGSPSPQNGTFVIWKCFMAWQNCFLSWATFQIGPKLSLLNGSQVVLAGNCSDSIVMKFSGL